GVRSTLYHNVPELLSFPSVAEWLNAIGMAMHQASFQEAGFTTFPLVHQITQEDLLRIGVHLPGHQKKILYSIEAMQAQASQPTAS
ncbi:unnamed protein product, partial [Lampetra fluviatilis]